MARITVEDCLTKETNRFALVLLAAKRTKQLLQGARPRIDEVKNKPVVTSLREIAVGKVRFMTSDEAREAEELGIDENIDIPPPELTPAPEIPAHNNGGNSKNGADDSDGDDGTDGL